MICLVVHCGRQSKELPQEPCVGCDETAVCDAISFSEMRLETHVDVVPLQAVQAVLRIVPKQLREV
jgi:hypothetical protein